MNLRTVLALAGTAAALFAAGCGGDGDFQQPFALCGNGRLDPGEQCDDGNVFDCDSCTSTCQNARCGDGLVWLGVETCDGNAFNSATTCSNTTVNLLDSCETFGFQNTSSGPGGGLSCNTGCQVQIAGCGLRLTPTPTEQATNTPLPTNTPGGATETPTPATGPVCGDGLLTGDEECACESGDTTCVPCPQDCAVGPCTVPDPAPTVSVQINWAPPFGVTASSVSIRVAYRSTEVSLPGSGFATGSTPPANRVTQEPAGSSTAVFDADSYIDVSVSRSGSLPTGRLFVLGFDTCDGGAPVAGDFACTIVGCASSSGDIPGCTCTAELLTPAPPTPTRTAPPPTATFTPTLEPTETPAPPTSTPTPTGPTPTITATPTGPTPTPTDTVPATATDTATPTPTMGLCGNGDTDFDAGETCDDGNTEDGDDCPANCMINTCAGASAGTVDVEVDFAAAGSEAVGGINVFLRYPDGVVRIPGIANQPLVLDSILAAPDGASITVNDREYGLTVVLIGTEAFPPPDLLTVQFQICPGQSAPSADAFTCTVFDASSPPPDPVPLGGVTCSVSIP